MDKQTARAWVIFVIAAMVVHIIGEMFEVTPVTFAIIMVSLALFALRYMPDKKL